MKVKDLIAFLGKHNGEKSIYVSYNEFISHETGWECAENSLEENMFVDLESHLVIDLLDR